MQYGKTWRTIAKLSLPDKYLRDTADDAPETRSERMFAELDPGERRGLKSSIAAVRARRQEKRAASRRGREGGGGGRGAGGEEGGGGGSGGRGGGGGVG